MPAGIKLLIKDKYFFAIYFNSNIGFLKSMPNLFKISLTLFTVNVIV